MRSNIFTGLGLAILLAGCATSSAPPPPPPVASGGTVDRALALQASAFESFTRRASGIGPDFSGAATVGAGLRTGAAYEPHQLATGMIAYAAMAALQEPGFTAGVRRAPPGLARRLAAQPGLALDLPGGPGAAARAGAALSRRGDALNGAGQRVKKAAYAVQRQGWSKARPANPADRLAQVKRISSAGYAPLPGDTAQLFSAISETGRGAASPLAARAVAVAALKVLGDETQARALMVEPRSASCLRVAKLNFHQCLASAGAHYEDIYCLGAHAMIEPGQCVADAARPTRSRRAGL